MGPFRTEDCLKDGAQFQKWSAAKFVDANMAACNAALRVIEFIRELKFPDVLIHGIATQVFLPLLPGMTGMTNEALAPWTGIQALVVLQVDQGVYHVLRDSLEKRSFADRVQVIVQSTGNKEPLLDLARDLAADLPIALGVAGGTK